MIELERLGKYFSSEGSPLFVLEGLNLTESLLLVLSILFGEKQTLNFLDRSLTWFS
jgi:hypothetical protein